MLDAYQSAHNHAIWQNLSTNAILKLTDRDRLDLMNRISTNKLVNLQPYEGAITLFLNANARILHYAHVLSLGETVLVVTPNNDLDTFLQRNIFWNDRLQIENVTNTYQQLMLAGPAILDLLSEWWPEAKNLPHYHVQSVDDTLLVRIDDLANLPAFLVLAPEAFATTIRNHLTTQEAVEASADIFELLRIEAGIPATKHELTDSYIPLELGLWQAVSFNKGCYTGQEIIARMESRGQLARKLVHILSDDKFSVGDTLHNADGKSTGSITSAMPKADNRGTVGLAVIKSADADAMQNLTTNTDAVVAVQAVAGTYQPQYD